MTADDKKERETEKTILVVEDDKISRSIFQRLLERNGYTIITAPDGRSGLEAYEKVKPDLIIMDIVMPQMGGLELLQTIRMIDFSTPIIIVSAFHSEAKEIKALECGADGFLIKPYNSEELLYQVKEVLLRDNRERETYRYKNLISILTRQNEILEQSIPKLSKKSKTVGQDIDKFKAICAAVAHDLKGEFLHIGNATKNLRELANFSPDLVEECGMIERSVEYSQLLLRRLLDYFDTGVPRLESIDVLELIKRTELLAKPRLPSSVRLEIVIDANFKERIVSANFEQLMGVLLEFIKNASTGMHNKGGIIGLNLYNRNGEVAISVKDNGPGIPEEIKELLFKQQMPSQSGLGLGLFLSNKIISTLGGRLNFETSSEGGTTFTILLPTIDNKKEF